MKKLIMEAAAMVEIFPENTFIELKICRNIVELKAILNDVNIKKAFAHGFTVVDDESKESGKLVMKKDDVYIDF